MLSTTLGSSVLQGSSRCSFAAGCHQPAARRSAAAPSVQRSGSLRVEALTKAGALTKKDISAMVAERLPALTKKEAESAVENTISVIMESVADGTPVSIAGFGTFEPRDRSARKGRNPQTGEELQIAATRVPAFSAAKGFKEAVKAKMADE